MLLCHGNSLSWVDVWFRVGRPSLAPCFLVGFWPCVVVCRALFLGSSVGQKRVERKSASCSTGQTPRRNPLLHFLFESNVSKAKRNSFWIQAVGEETYQSSLPKKSKRKNTENAASWCCSAGWRLSCVKKTVELNQRASEPRNALVWMGCKAGFEKCEKCSLVYKSHLPLTQRSVQEAGKTPAAFGLFTLAQLRFEDEWNPLTAYLNHTKVVNMEVNPFPFFIWR